MSGVTGTQGKKRTKVRGGDRGLPETHGTMFGICWNCSGEVSNQ